jgi:hypothetical protein
MEVQELDLSAELVGQEVELLQGKAMLGPIRLGTELAIEVAHIGYFKIASGNHRNGMDIKKISNRKTTADFCDPLRIRIFLFISLIINLFEEISDNPPPNSQ